MVEITAFEFTMQLDRLRRFRVNASARARFAALAGFEFNDLETEYPKRPPAARAGIVLVLIHSFGVELDPTLTLDRAREIMNRVIIDPRTSILAANSPLAKIAGGPN